MQFSFVAPATATSFCRPLRSATAVTPTFSASKPVRTAAKPSSAPRQPPTAAAWPAQRFLSNFFFFTPLGKLLRGSAPNASFTTMAPTVLVTGGSGGTGRRVVRLLLSSTDPAYNVVLLTRSRPRALEAMKDQGLDVQAVKQYEQQGRLRIVVSDMVNIPPDAVFGVTATISCTGTKVGPKDDDDQRSKYYQGIILYPATVLDETPQSVEYVSVKRMGALMRDEYAATKGTRVANPIFDFGDEEATRKTWGILDDVVMGGVSQSTARSVRGALLFSGVVSTQNNGGFASSRTADFDSPLDLTGFDGFQLRVRGDGQRYKMVIRCERKWDGVGFCYSFDTKRDEWAVVNVPFAECRPVFRGRTVTTGGGRTLDARNIVAVQLMLSKFEYDGELNPSFTPGKFSLLVARVQPFQYTAKGKGSEQESGLPKYIHLSSAGVTRPQRLDELKGTPPGEIPLLKIQESIGRILDWKMAGEDSLRALPGLAYTIVRSCALTMEEKTGLGALKFSQGDLATGRVTRDDMAELLVTLLKCPSAVGKTYEVATREADESAAAGKTGNDKEKAALIDATLWPLSTDFSTQRTFGPFPYVPAESAVKKG